MKKFAMRNLRLCTKDCLCLYVCPTGAADTENSIIDREKCIGCGACAESCPSKAISMVPVDMPPQQPKEAAVLNKLNALSGSKAAQEAIARELGQSTNNPALDQLARALEKSNRLMVEDILREAGYMLPQSGNATVSCGLCWITRTTPMFPWRQSNACWSCCPPTRRNRRQSPPGTGSLRLGRSAGAVRCAVTYMKGRCLRILPARDANSRRPCLSGFRKMRRR